MREFLDSLFSFRDSPVLTLEAVVLSVLAAFVLGQVVAWLYVRTQRGTSYSPVVAQSLVILATIIALVMLVVGNSLARAFGLFGALALIRFRTPVKDVRDTVFLFYAVAVGITVGTMSFVAAAAGTVLIGLAVLWLSAVAFGRTTGNDGLLRFRCPPDDERDARVRDVLRRFCRSQSLLHVREAGPATEFAWEISLRDPDATPRLLGEMSRIDGVHDLSLLLQREETQP